MQKNFCVILTVVLFLSAPAKSQDALGTFAFIFLNEKVDMTRTYGNELVTEDPMGDSLILSMPSKCVFEARFKKTGRLKGRWDFNKAFFGEMRVIGDRAEIPGEIGMRYIALMNVGRGQIREGARKSM